MDSKDEAALREIAERKVPCICLFAAGAEPLHTQECVSHDEMVRLQAAFALGRASGWRAGRLGEALTLLDEASSRVKDATEAGIAEGLFDREDAEGDFDFIARIDEFKRLVTDDQRVSVEWCRCGHEKILHRTDKDGAFCTSSEVECQCPRYERASVSGERDGGVKGMYTPDDLVVLLREYIHAIDIDDDELLQRDVAMLNRVLAALAIVAATKPTDRNAGRDAALRAVKEWLDWMDKPYAETLEGPVDGKRIFDELRERRAHVRRVVEAALKGGKP